MEKDKPREWPYESGLPRDNVIEWADKIIVLGEMLSGLMWHIEHYDGDADVLLRCGEGIGNIFKDYAILIRGTAEESMNNFINDGERIVLPLAQCKAVYEFIGKTRRIEDLVAINFRLDELDSFIKNIALPAMQLKTGFEELKREIIAQKTNADTGVTAAAKA